MNKRKTNFETALDKLVDDAAKLAAERMGERLSEPETPVEFSPEHEANMKKLFRRERAKLARKKALKYTGTAAACLAVILLLGSTLMMPSTEAWRIKFMNFTFESEKPNTDYNFTENAESTYSDSEIDLRYLPSGFVMTESRTEEESGQIYRRFSRGSEYFELTAVKGGNTAVFGEEDNISVIWHGGAYAYKLTGNIAREELVKISKNVRN